MPEEANGIIEWFEIYYIHGNIRRITRSGNVIRSDPLFPPSLWSVTEVLVGGTHVGIFKMITEIQKEQNRVKLETESILRGLPRKLP